MERGDGHHPNKTASSMVRSQTADSGSLLVLAKQTTMKPCRGFPEFGKGKRTASEDWTRNQPICRSSKRRRKVVMGEERFATTVKNEYPLCGQCCFKAVQYWDVLKPWFRDAGTLHEEFSADMDSRWRKHKGLEVSE